MEMEQCTSMVPVGSSSVYTMEATNFVLIIYSTVLLRLYINQLFMTFSKYGRRVATLASIDTNCE